MTGSKDHVELDSASIGDKNLNAVLDSGGAGHFISEEDPD